MISNSPRPDNVSDSITGKALGRRKYTPIGIRLLLGTSGLPWCLAATGLPDPTWRPLLVWVFVGLTGFAWLSPGGPVLTLCADAATTSGLPAPSGCACRFVATRRALTAALRKGFWSWLFGR